jgi:hypothetical protein
VSRLTNRITSDSKAPGGPYVPPESNGDGLPFGVLVDDAVMPLEGQPPLAVTKGWGNLSGIVGSATP